MIFRTSFTLAGTSFFKNIIRNGSGKSSTIFSLCSGHGKCGVSVFRISGPDALSAIKSMTKINTRSSTLTKKAVFHAKILHSRTQKQIDQGIVLWFPGPNSFTGEDVCELQTHGGPAIAKLILSSLSSLQKFRPALPGEFIRRSFENSKIDLTQVEGLHDLINAETSEQHSLALNMYNGQLKETYTNWSNTLLKNLAYLEALVDFGEEDNLDENIYNKAIQSITCLHAEVANHLNDNRIYEQIKDGVKVCIIGKSNVGKSSLLNALCKRQAALVSSQAGTTRDIIEVTVNVDGYMLVVSDTAGMRETVDKVERLGIERAVDCFHKANVVVLVMETINEKIRRFINSAEAIIGTKNELDLLSKISEKFIVDSLEEINLKGSLLKDKFLILVFNKSDLISENEMTRMNSLIAKLCTLATSHLDSSPPEDQKISSPELHSSTSQYAESIMSLTKMTTYCLASCLRNNGLLDFEKVLQKNVKMNFESNLKTNVSFINARHEHHLNAVCNNLKNFLSIVLEDKYQGETCDIRLELSIEELRNAFQNIAYITGKVTTDQVLEKIFSEFCIGK